MSFYLRAISYFRDDLGKIVAMVALIGVSVGAGLLHPYPIAILVDCVSKGFPPENAIYRAFFALAPESKVGQIIALAVTVLALRVVQELTQMSQTLLKIQVGYAGLMRVRCDVFRKLQELSLAYHKSQPQGDAIYRVTWDTLGFQSVLNVVVEGVLVSAITLVVMIIFMLTMSWQLTLVALAIAPILIWTTRIYARILRSKSLEAKEVESALTWDPLESTCRHASLSIL